MQPALWVRCLRILIWLSILFLTFFIFYSILSLCCWLLVPFFHCIDKNASIKLRATASQAVGYQ